MADTSALTSDRVGDIAYVREAYHERSREIKLRLQDFSVVPPKDWFYELCYCLCTPQSKAVHANEVVAALKAQNFQLHEFDPTPLLRDPRHYIRFHNTKAKNLCAMREMFSRIEQQLVVSCDTVTHRSWLVQNVRGLGMKEASHFLRNIGHREVAIIDRHILKHLFRCGVIRDIAFPSSIKKYEEIERGWKTFASDISIPLDELDLLFWSLETGHILK